MGLFGSIYKGLDRVASGYLPGAHRPAHEWAADEVFPAVSDIIEDPMGRNLATSEAQTAREHATAERLDAQEFSSAEALEARNFNALEAQKSRDHSQMMAETEYSRKMASMRDAGLNPVLAAGGWGTGSNVPSSAQAQGPAASSHAGSSPSANISTMAPLQSLLLAAQIRDISSASKLKDEQRKDLEITRDPRIGEMEGRVELIGAQISELGASQAHKEKLTSLVQKQIDELAEKVKSAKSQAEIDAIRSQWERSVGGDIRRWSDAVGIKGSDITDLVATVLGVGKFATVFAKYKSKSGTVGTHKPETNVTSPDRHKSLQILVPPSWKD